MQIPAAFLGTPAIAKRAVRKMVRSAKARPESMNIGDMSSCEEEPEAMLLPRSTGVVQGSHFQLSPFFQAVFERTISKERDDDALRAWVRWAVLRPWGIATLTGDSGTLVFARLSDAESKPFLLAVQEGLDALDDCGPRIPFNGSLVRFSEYPLGTYYQMLHRAGYPASTHNREELEARLSAYLSSHSD